MTAVHTPWTRHLTIVTALLAVSPLLAQTQSNLVKRYRLIELTGDADGQSRAYGINLRGQVVGWTDSGGVRHSAYWHNRTGSDLHGTVHFELVHPFSYFDQDYSEAYAISDAGQVVGTARSALKCAVDTITVTNGFLLRPGVMTDMASPYPGDALTNLGTLAPMCLWEAYDSAATDISGTNLVVGWADYQNRVIRAFIVVPQNGFFYRDQSADGVNDYMQNLGILPVSGNVLAADPVSSATAVNDAGQVTGYSYTMTSSGYAAYHGFVVTPRDTNSDSLPDQWFEGVEPVNNLMTDVGTLGGRNSWGRDINNRGEAVGEADYDHSNGTHYSRAFFWSSGQIYDLGSLRADRTVGFSAASAINDSGAIVGWAENDKDQRRAVIWDEGQVRDLNDYLYLFDEEGLPVRPTIVLTEARDINQDGVIVGWGTVKGTNGTVTRGFLLNPVWIDPAALVEEASTPQTTPSAPAEPSPTDYTSNADFGPPTTPDVETAGETEEYEPGDSHNPTLPAFCGAGGFGLLPLTLFGLACWKANGRRRT